MKTNLIRRKDKGAKREARSALLKAQSSLLLALMLLSVPALRAQTLEGFTAPAGRVLLMWGPDSTTPGVRYNVYRKLASSPTWPGTPLNGTPLGPVTNCVQFKGIIPEGSGTWNMISYALADSTGGVPPVTPLANVCTIATLPVGTEKWRRVQVFAGFMPTVARAMGQSYEDNTATAGQTYNYRIVRVNGGTEMAVLPGSEITITAGTPGAIPTPGSLQAVAGDSKVQVLWAIPASAKFQGFDVQRALVPGGPWTKVSDVDFSATISSTINQDTLIPDKHGFTDYERYDSTGAPIAHAVPNPPGADVMVSGPRDGVTYFYRVRHKDPLGNGGAWSGNVSAIPRDSAKPTVPQAINVTAIESMNGIQVRWNKVTNDIEGHREAMRGYRVYRYEQPEDPNVGATAVGGMIAQPGDTSLTLTFIDTSPGLRSACGDKTYYYRVEAIDSSGNTSYRSIAVGDALKDTTRPDNVKGTEAEGFDDYIQVRWDLNTDCDIGEYRIYRAYCNFGDWLPCPDKTYDRETQEIFRKYLSGYQQPGTASPTTHYDPKAVNPARPYDCGGPFELIGTISHEEARERREAAGKAYFDDRTVPPGSPICYAYIVKAVDRSQNESGKMPIPDPAKEIIICQRLRDRTPPGPAIIAGLFARDSAVIVEWIGPPVQDIAAYHVYRAETENGTYTWTGGRTVVPPPGTGVVLTSPYTPPAVVGCDSIPLVSRDWMSAGSIVDTVEPRDIWWYKVVGVDQQGNETSPDSAVGISTFTFKSNRDDAPEISSVSATDGPCALEIQWGPSFDADSTIGFAVFRCKSAGGDYYQVGNVVQTNSFTDNTVARNVTYWYRIAMLKKDGSLSRLSTPRHGVHP